MGPRLGRHHPRLLPGRARASSRTGWKLGLQGAGLGVKAYAATSLPGAKEVGYYGGAAVGGRQARDRRRAHQRRGERGVAGGPGR